MLDNFLYFCTMDAKQKQQLAIFKQLGININRYTYLECVDILIEKYTEACDALEYTEEERYRKELLRITKPTN